MKWSYSVKQKSKAAFLLAGVLVLVLVKNMLDSSNVSKLGNSFAAVYEDRLLVESYIYQLSGHLYQKKMMVDNCASGENVDLLQEKLNAHNGKINTLLLDYGKTRLTPAEATYFSSFQQSMAHIRELETRYLQTQESGRAGGQTKHQIDRQYGVAANQLNQLSHIQVAEGKRLNDQSKQIIAGSTILTQFELVLIIGIGIMIQMLVFASKSKLSTFPQNPMLN